MRDFHDAKVMAATLRKSLIAKAVNISHGESLEIVSKMLGAADWNTLSALLQKERHAGAVKADYPALPIRDFVPFPASSFPLYVGRQKTMLALEQAFQRNREVVLVIQKDAAIDEPRFSDIYQIGVLAGLMEFEVLPENRVRRDFRRPEGDAGQTTKIMLQSYRRVMIRNFIAAEGAFRAEISDISEGPIREAAGLVRHAAEQYRVYVAAYADRPAPKVPGGNIHYPTRTKAVRLRRMQEILPALGQIRDPGRMADVIGQHLHLPVGDSQGLLALLDPIDRLEKVVTFMGGMV